MRHTELSQDSDSNEEEWIMAHKDHSKEADRRVLKTNRIFLSSRAASMSHVRVNGFYFEHTKQLQSRRRILEERERKGSECNIWSAHGDVVILNSLVKHTEGITVREGRQCSEGKEEPRKGGKKGRSEGAINERRATSKKRRRGKQWSQRVGSTCGCGGSDPVMEGDKFSGKPNLQLRCPLVLKRSELYSSDWVTFMFFARVHIPLCGIFHSVCLVCWLHVFFWGLELGAQQLLDRSLADLHGCSCNVSRLSPSSLMWLFVSLKIFWSSRLFHSWIPFYFSHSSCLI